VSHFVQEDELSGKVLRSPILQSLQNDAPDDEKLPGKQFTHKAAPVMELYFPDAQKSQAVFLVSPLNVP
jgi:hypothetical protein